MSIFIILESTGWEIVLNRDFESNDARHATNAPCLIPSHHSGDELRSVAKELPASETFRAEEAMRARSTQSVGRLCF